MKVVAITSCATGIAHTYMAAEAIKKICKQKGYSCRVIFANDVGISKVERFHAYENKIKRFKPHEVIKNPSIIFEN